MRIAIEARHATTDPTGIGTVAIELVRALADQPDNHEYIVYTPNPSPLDDLKSRRNVTLCQSASASAQRPRQLVWQYLTAPGDARRRRADLYHATSYVAPPWAPSPTVLTVHDIFALEHPEWCPRSNAAHFRLTLPGAIHRAARIVVPTDAVRREIVKRLLADEGKIDVIPHGVPRAMTEPGDPENEASIRRRLGLPERYFLFMGNIEPKKNILTMATACAELRRRHPGAPPLVLAGKKGWRQKGVWHKLENFIGRRDVQWIGYAPREAKAALYRGALATLMVSRGEGFGLPVVESMACGTPVVVSDTPALLEVAVGAAPAVPVDDIDALIGELRRLADDEAYRRHWIEAGRQRATQLTWEHAAQLTLETYRRAFDETARRNG